MQILILDSNCVYIKARFMFKWSLFMHPLENGRAVQLCPYFLGHSSIPYFFKLIHQGILTKTLAEILDRNLQIECCAIDYSNKPWITSWKSRHDMFKHRRRSIARNAQQKSICFFDVPAKLLMPESDRCKFVDDKQTNKTFVFDVV